MDRYFRSIQIFIATVLLCSAAISSAAQVPDEVGDDAPDDIPAEEELQPGEAPVSLREEWRDTLQFGIDSKVIELLSTLESRRETGLNDELRERFEMSSNSELRRKIFDFFRMLEDSSIENEALDILLYFYEYNNPLIRAAIQYIGAVEIEYQEEAADLLLELAEEDNASYSTHAVNAIAAMQRKQDAEYFIAMLEESTIISDPLRESIILALGTIGHPVAVDALIALLQDDTNPATHRQFAADSLGKIQDPAAIPALEQAMSSDENLLRAYAVSALGRFPDADNTRMLQQALRDSYWRTREVALDGIRNAKLVASLPAVQYMSRNDPEQKIRRKAINTIAALDHPDGWEFIHTHLGSDNTPQDLRILMMQLSIENNLENSRDVLMTILEEEWDQENSQMLDQMGRKMSTTDNPDLEDFLVRLLDHPNFVIRMYAVRGISRNRLTKYRETLEELTEEGHPPALRREAVGGLEQL